MALDSTWHLVLIALVVWALPGWLFSMAAGMRPHRALVASIPVTAGVWGSLAALYGGLNIPFTQVSVWVGTAVVVVLMLLWQVLVGRMTTHLRSKRAARKALKKGETDSAEAQSAETEQTDTEHTDTEHTDTEHTDTEHTDTEHTDTEHTDTEHTETEPKQQRDWKALLLGLARPILPALGVIGGSWLMIKRGLDAMVNTPHGLNSVYQGWDSQWHASSIRFIMENDVASSTHMGDLQNIETHTQLFYPSAWHAMVYMFAEATGLTPIESVNISAKVMPAVGVALTASLLTWIIARGATRRAGLGTAVATFIAPIIAAGVLPLFYVSFYVGMWPYASAMAFIGPVIWLFCRIPSSPRMITPAALALAGVGMMHPAPITHIVMFVAMWWLGEGVLRTQSDASWGVKNKYLAPVVSRVRATIYMGIAGVIAVVIFLPQLLVGSSQTSEVSNFTDTQDGITRLESWTSILYLQTRHAWEYGIDWWFTWAAALGVIIVLIWRRNLWALAVFLLFVTIAVDSVLNFAGPVGDLARAVGSLHYNSAHRLIMPVAFLEVVFAAAAIGFIFHTIFQVIPTAIKRHGKSITPLVTGSVTLGAVIAVLLGTQLPGATQSQKRDGFDFLMNSAYKGRMVTDIDLRAYDWLATQPKAYDGLILNNPDEGSGWMYAYNGLPSLHRHYLWPTVDVSSRSTLLYWHPDALGAGNPPDPGSPAEAAAKEGLPTKGLEGDHSQEKNTVDKAVDDLNINYIVFGPPHYWAWQRDIVGQGPRLYNAPGVTPIYQDGQLYIYAVNARFTDEELEKIVQDSPHKPTHPPVQAPDAVDTVVTEPQNVAERKQTA